jgi:hypothetical protein
MPLDAFQPQGLTQLISVTTTPSTAVLLSAPQVGCRIQTDGLVHFAFGSSAGSSLIQAAVASTSTPANGIPVLANSAEVFNIGAAAYVSLVSTAAGPTNVRLTPGFGI